MNCGRGTCIITYALILPSLLLAGCGRAPSFDVVGSFFPAWLFCLDIAVLLTILTRWLFLQLRSQIRKWPPQLRMLSLTRITLFKYRLQLTGFELPAVVRASQLEFDSRLTMVLDGIADRMEGRTPAEDPDFADAFEHLEKAVRTCSSEGLQRSMAIELKTFLALSRTAESLVMSLEKEIQPPKLVRDANQP